MGKNPPQVRIGLTIFLGKNVARLVCECVCELFVNVYCGCALWNLFVKVYFVIYDFTNTYQVTSYHLFSFSLKKQNLFPRMKKVSSQATHNTISKSLFILNPPCSKEVSKRGESYYSITHHIWTPHFVTLVYENEPVSCLLLCTHTKHTHTKHTHTKNTLSTHTHRHT